MRSLIATMLLVTACAGSRQSPDTASAVSVAKPAPAPTSATALTDSSAGPLSAAMRQAALPITSLPHAARQTGSDATQPQGVSKAGGLSQWSGYVSQVRYEGDKMYFVTPCQAPQAYWVYRSQVVSLNQNGICGNYAQFYAVINY
jgi:hypothetical protein